MHNQNYPSLLLHSISTIIIILITSSTSFCDEDALFFNCSSPFSCGAKFPNISYPFWGGYKSQECGLPGFEVKCQQDDHLTIDISSQTFRVLGIDVLNHNLRVARDDLWDYICPENYNSISINPSLFRLGPNVENIDLSYACDGYAGLPPRNLFSCSIDGNTRDVFFKDQLGSSASIPSCELNISVPVLESAREEFRRIASMSLIGLLQQGFSLEYTINDIACSACVNTAGMCWSGTNSTSPTCLCPDGNNQFICSSDRGSPIFGKNRVAKLAIGASAAGILIIICLVVILYCKIKKPSIASHLIAFRSKSKDNQNLEALIKQNGSLSPRRYSYLEIKKMTNSFNDKLGKGGYGDVYKGNLFDNRPVAVKILNTSKGSGEEFINEVASISRTAHVNVVTLLGFCLDGDKRALIYEFMPNGSLEKYIHAETAPKTENDHLGWGKLYQIAVGIARGLEYLHKGCNIRILHFDIKPHNILLDEDFCPKISDFGLAKLCTNKESIISMTGARGTIGYIAPELVCRSFGGVSHKSDVYSYGMMLLEMVGGRKNISVEVSHTSEIYFPYWAYQRMVLDEDLNLQGVLSQEENEIARKMIVVGFWCIQADPSQRPAVSKVIEMLEGDFQALEIPPKPFFGSPSTPPQDSSTSTVVVLS